MQYICGEFKSENEIEDDPLEDRKCRIRLLQLIEKARIELTNNDEAEIEWESLFQQKNLAFTLTLEDFE